MADQRVYEPIDQLASAGGRSTTNMAKISCGVPLRAIGEQLFRTRFSIHMSARRDRQPSFSPTRIKQGLPLGLRMGAGMHLRWLADRPLLAGACIRTEECSRALIAGKESMGPDKVRSKPRRHADRTNYNPDKDGESMQLQC